MRIKLNGTVLNILEAGIDNKDKNNPSLVFLHYFGGSSLAWKEVIAELSSDYHCIAPDLRGFGVSEVGDGNYSVDENAGDILALVKHFALKNYMLVGHSMGGKFALWLAAKNPENLRSLILLAPSPPSPEPIKDDERARMIETHGPRATAIETIDKASGKSLSGEIFERAIKDNLRTSEAAWRAWLEIGSREDISAETANIDVPVLVATGANDKSMTPQLLTETIVQPVRDARLVVIPNAHHLLPLEVPAAVANLIREQR